MIYKFAVVFSILFIIFIANLVRKEKLDEKYSILWLIFAFVILIVALFPKIITWFANKFNVYYPPALLLLLGILVLGAYIVHISVVITKQNKMIVRLNQEIGILKAELQNDEKNNNNVKKQQNKKQEKK